MVDWLIVYCFTSRSRIFHLYGDVTIAGERLQNLGLCWALRVFEQRGIFIVPHLLWHGASVLPVSSKGPPHSIASYDTRGDVKDLFQPGSLKDTASFLLLHVSRNSFWTNSASHEYKNKSANKGAKPAPTGMPMDPASKDHTDIVHKKAKHTLNVYFRVRSGYRW
jgi:hypothetical protein